jgi:small-conductance mechanosensitive channel
MHRRRAGTGVRRDGCRPCLRIFVPLSVLLFATIALWPGRLPAQSATAVKPSDPKAILSYLNQSIDWYRQYAVEQQLATDPEDVLFVNDHRQLADQIIRLSFEFALAEADLEPRAGTTNAQTLNAPSAAPRSGYASLPETAAKADQQVKKSQDELQSWKAKLEGATARNRKAIESAIAETQSELKLAEARRDMLRNMVQFVGGINVGAAAGGSLRSQIEALQRGIPAAAAAPKTPPTGQNAPPQEPPASVPVMSATHKTEPTGILGLTSEFISLAKKSRKLDETTRLTDSLLETTRGFLRPLARDLRQLAAGADYVAGQPESSDPAVLAQQKKYFDTMTQHFQQVSVAALPLGKQSILLDLYKRSLTNWREAVHTEYGADLRSLLVRLGMLAIALATVFVFSRLWRKAIFRYIPDARRRYQFLLLRRIVVWFVVIVVVAFAFATELGSLATFAGLLTAGVAVALQNVILSVAGYFFLISKYGVRVGDRVQVSGVTGEVVDIGLVRLHLMELGTGRTDAQPTGRVVAFSNSVVFQANAGLFRQIPGTNFIWHEITLTLAPDSNYRTVEDRLMKAVDSVFADYRDSMEMQRRQMEMSLSLLSVDSGSFRPQSRLRVTQSGLEVIIRYPLELAKAAEVDDRITRALLEAIEREPKLRLVGTGMPNLQPVEAPPPTEAVKQ